MQPPTWKDLDKKLEVLTYLFKYHVSTPNNILFSPNCTHCIYLISCGSGEPPSWPEGCVQSTENRNCFKATLVLKSEIANFKGLWTLLCSNTTFWSQAWHHGLWWWRHILQNFLVLCCIVHHIAKTLLALFGIVGPKAGHIYLNYKAFTMKKKTEVIQSVGIHS